MNIKPFKRLTPFKDVVSAGEWNRMCSVVEALAQSYDKSACLVDSTGIHSRIVPGVGGGGGTTRIARIAENATATDHIKGSLWSESTGIIATEGAEFETELYALMLGSSRLDMVSEILVIGDYVPVFQAIYDDSGTPTQAWYINFVFNAGEEHWGYDN